MVEGNYGESIDETNDTTSYDGEKFSAKLHQVIYKSEEKIDICIKILFPSVSFTNEIIKSVKEIKKDKNLKLRCVTEITKDNINYCKKLVSIIEELRHFEKIKGNFLINETSCAYISIVQKTQQEQQYQLINNTAKSFVEQQQFFFELLWDKSIPAYQKINEIEEETKRENEEEILQSIHLPLQHHQQPIKTKVLENQQEILKTFMDFYKNSDEIRFCSPVESIKLIYNNFYIYHQEILERYRQGNHKGIKWITSINNQKDVELVKSFLNEGIDIRHVKDLLSINFAISEKTFLFTIERMEEGKMVTNALNSNDKLYINHYYTVFENLWKKGIDVKNRINAIEKGHSINVDVIPNPIESLRLSRWLLDNAKSEVLIILSSATAIFRVENNIGFEIFDDLASKRIKVKILIPLGDELDFKIKQLKSKYTKIDFRNLHTTLKSLIGITVIDREKVLLAEIKDETNVRYVDSIGLTLFLEGKSAALSYFSIFDSLWKQTEIYDEIKKAYEKLQIHEKMQKEFINTAAHELRTPLQPIIGIAKILNNEIQNKRHRELFDVLVRNVQRLKSLSEDIIDVTKIEGNSLISNKVHFKIMNIIFEVIENYKKEATLKNISFECLFSENNQDLVVYADKIRITQAISNLICNSIKFINVSKENGTITIVVEKGKKSDNYNIDSKDMVVVIVKDTGAGIDEQILPNLFTKFASKSVQGTGLGLYIAKSIIEAHGGTIWAKNNNKEDGQRGATFSFTLPLVNQLTDQST